MLVGIRQKSNNENVTSGISGTFEFVGLKLRPDALHDLHEDLNIKDGFIGKLGVQFSTAKFLTEPIVVNIEDITLVCSLQDISNSPEAIKKRIAENYMKKFKALEEAEKQKAAKPKEVEIKKDKSSSNAKKVSDKDTMFDKLTAKAITNLQVNIKNIHIRYEDVTYKKNPFVLGLFLGSLSIKSTDGKWVPALNTPGRIAFKVVELNNLSAYFATSSLIQYSESDQMKDKDEGLTDKRAKTRLHQLMVELISQKVDGRSENVIYDQKELIKEQQKQKLELTDSDSGENKETAIAPLNPQQSSSKSQLSTPSLQPLPNSTISTTSSLSFPPYFEQREFLLQPLNLNIHVQYTLKQTKGAPRPMVIVDISLPSLALQIGQYHLPHLARSALKFLPKDPKYKNLKEVVSLEQRLKDKQEYIQLWKDYLKKIQKYEQSDLLDEQDLRCKRAQQVADGMGEKDFIMGYVVDRDQEALKQIDIKINEYKIHLFEMKYEAEEIQTFRTIAEAGYVSQKKKEDEAQSEYDQKKQQIRGQKGFLQRTLFIPSAEEKKLQQEFEAKLQEIKEQCENEEIDEDEILNNVGRLVDLYEQSEISPENIIGDLDDKDKKALFGDSDDSQSLDELIIDSNSEEFILVRAGFSVGSISLNLLDKRKYISVEFDKKRKQSKSKNKTNQSEKELLDSKFNNTVIPFYSFSLINLRGAASYRPFNSGINAALMLDNLLLIDRAEEQLWEDEKEDEERNKEEIVQYSERRSVLIEYNAENRKKERKIVKLQLDKEKGEINKDNKQNNLQIINEDEEEDDQSEKDIVIQRRLQTKAQQIMEIESGSNSSTSSFIKDQSDSTGDKVPFLLLMVQFHPLASDHVELASQSSSSSSVSSLQLASKSKNPDISLSFRLLPLDIIFPTISSISRILQSVFRLTSSDSSPKEKPSNSASQSQIQSVNIQPVVAEQPKQQTKQSDDRMLLDVNVSVGLPKITLPIGQIDQKNQTDKNPEDHFAVIKLGKLRLQSYATQELKKEDDVQSAPSSIFDLFELKYTYLSIRFKSIKYFIQQEGKGIKKDTSQPYPQFIKYSTILSPLTIKGSLHQSISQNDLSLAQFRGSLTIHPISFIASFANVSLISTFMNLYLNMLLKNLNVIEKDKEEEEEEKEQLKQIRTIDKRVQNDLMHQSILDLNKANDKEEKDQKEADKKKQKEKEKDKVEIVKKEKAKKKVELVPKEKTKYDIELNIEKFSAILTNGNVLNKNETYIQEEELINFSLTSTHVHFVQREFDISAIVRIGSLLVTD
ncbi:MAG: hypothetical protein EZS28_025503, partial [Streblomastix strix]